MRPRIALFLLLVLGVNNFFTSIVQAATPAGSLPIQGGEKPTEIIVSLSTKSNDIAFDKTAIQVSFGKPIKLIFRNDASKGTEIQHNIAILRPGTTDSVFKELQAINYDIAAIKKNPSILAMTKTLDPGTQDSLEFTPPEPGFYPYVCLMAGHGDMLGMRGILEVKK